VLNIDQAQRAIDAGAQFGMAPGFDRSVVSFFQDRSIPFVPGVMTPTEIQLAVNHGCTQLKFFPAETMGGVQAIKSISAPFRYHGIRFCATGGINQHNFTDYLQMPGVFAVGGSWLATEDQMMRSDWQAITLQVKQAVSAAQALGL
jgi:2-dehydro-3-deoxyphosphogluconate aldolase/(4S)-4-hydroxy-2-oxoglutarate aldolase